jgi:hypothetical protein
MSQPIYYAVWLGTPTGWSSLYTIVNTEQDARHLVSNCEQFGKPAYYTTEQGPIVPLGLPDVEDDRCYCCGDEHGHDPDPLGVFHVNEQVLALARKERGDGR